MKPDGTIFTLDDKNNEIFENLKPTLMKQLESKQNNALLKKPQQLKFGAIINNKLLELFRSYGLMRDEDVETFDAEDLKEYYLHFMSLVNRISLDIEITPTKPLLCAYMGITTNIFNRFESPKADENIRKWVDAINGDLTHSIFDSSLQGNAGEKAALTFASTKNYGQETVQNDFNATITTKQEVEYTPAQALSKANSAVALIAEMKKSANKKEREKRR